ncbi:MAG TPA: hypothetical protein VKL21_08470 [Candidatus Methanoperedens sp.]|nr:hypothetical protein [Candidatus Methanoperedens sp.]
MIKKRAWRIACSRIPTCSRRQSARPKRSRAGIALLKSMSSITFSRFSRTLGRGVKG